MKGMKTQTYIKNKNKKEKGEGKGKRGEGKGEREKGRGEKEGDIFQYRQGRYIRLDWYKNYTRTYQRVHKGLR